MNVAEDLSRAAQAVAGEKLPQRSFAIGLSNVVAMSLATRDFHPVHHDTSVALRLGHRSVFINIMTTAGLVETFVRSWCGRQGRLAGLKLKLGVPHYAGETLVLDGEVTQRGEDDSGRWIMVAFTASNPCGLHASGSVRILYN